MTEPPDEDESTRTGTNGTKPPRRSIPGLDGSAAATARWLPPTAKIVVPQLDEATRSALANLTRWEPPPNLLASIAKTSFDEVIRAHQFQIQLPEPVMSSLLEGISAQLRPPSMPALPAIGELAPNVLTGIIKTAMTHVPTPLIPAFTPPAPISISALFDLPSAPALLPTSFTAATTALADLWKSLSRRWPQNWPKSLQDLESIEQIASTGIPVVYVPRAQTITALIDASTIEERLQLLLDKRTEIVADCRAILTESELDTAVEQQHSLTLEALDALDAGSYPAAAQALAVAVCDTLIKRHLPSDYNTIARRAREHNLDEAFDAGAYRIALAIRPLGVMLTEWSDKSHQPIPTMLSRHVTLHHASRDHLHETNAIIAVMAATSLLLAFTELKKLNADTAKQLFWSRRRR